MVELSHPYMTTGKTIALIRRKLVGKVMSLLFNTLSSFVIAFLSRSKCLLISCWQSLSAVILEPRKIKPTTSDILLDICIWNIYVALCKSILLYLTSAPGGSAGKESACNVGDPGSIPGLGGSPGEGNGYPLQHSGLENYMDYSPWRLKESDMTEWLSLSA